MSYYRRTNRFVLCDSRHIRVHTKQGQLELKGPEKFQRAGEEETNRNILLGTPDSEFQCEKGGWNREALRLHL